MRSTRSTSGLLGVPTMILLGAALLASADGLGQVIERPRREPGERPPAPAPLRKLHRDPANCNENAVDIEITREPADPVIANGSVVSYTVTLKNETVVPGSIPCNATNISLSLTCPGSDGNPTGTTTTLATNASISSGATQVYGPVVCTINVNPGVGIARARGDFNGTVHAAPPDDVASGSKTISVVILQPTSTPTATVTASPAATGSPTRTPTLPAPTVTVTAGTGGPGGGVPTEPIPTLSPAMLALLAASIAAIALVVLRRMS